MTRIVSLVCAVVLLGATAFYALTTPEAYTALRGDHAHQPTRARDLENGQTLFHAGGCASCHAATDDESRTHLSGGKPLVTPFGTFYPPNISPDPDDGLGGWTEAQFIRAMREGTAPDGRPYYPAFPYTSYRGMTADDAADIFAYLKTLPALKGRAAEHQLAFPFSLRRGVALWKLAFLSNTVIAKDPKQSEAWNRGHRLVEGVGHCGECHTPRTIAASLDRSRAFAGAPALEGKGFAPNLTPHETGLQSWSSDEIASLLKDGFTPDADSVGGSMADVVRNTSTLTDADRLAMATYLKSLPPIPSVKPKSVTP